jgi:hypothetical protein
MTLAGQVEAQWRQQFFGLLFPLKILVRRKWSPRSPDTHLTGSINLRFSKLTWFSIRIDAINAYWYVIIVEYHFSAQDDTWDSNYQHCLGLPLTLPKDCWVVVSSCLAQDGPIFIDVPSGWGECFSPTPRRCNSFRIPSICCGCWRGGSPQNRRK